MDEGDGLAYRCMAFCHSPWAHVVNIVVVVCLVIWVEHRAAVLQGTTETLHDSIFKVTTNLGVVEKTSSDISQKYSALLDTDLVSKYQALADQAKDIKRTLTEAKDLPERVTGLEDSFGMLMFMATEARAVATGSPIPFFLP